VHKTRTQLTTATRNDNRWRWHAAARDSTRARQLAGTN